MIKHNYSDLRNQKVHLWLSKNEKALVYRNLNPESKVLGFLRGDRTINFSDIVGFFYGPNSSTFEARKAKVIDALNLDENMKISTKDVFALATGTEEVEDDNLSAMATIEVGRNN